jgi:hypothetical protein
MIAEVPEGAGLLEALSAKRNSAIASIAELEMSISKIDAVMQLYEPAHVPWKSVVAGLEALKAPVVESSGNGTPATEVDRFFGSDQRTAVVIGIMVKAASSMSSSEIADAYVSLKGTSLEKEPFQLLVSRISAILSRLRKQGKVETQDTPGWKNTWRLL